MEAEFTGEPLTIAFNPQYLLDGLGALDAPTAVLSFTDPIKPAVITARPATTATSVARLPLPDHADPASAADAGG